MRSAAELEDSTEKHPVTPAPVVPARELLGEMLLELNQPAEALLEFEASSGREPNRFNGLFGAARAAELSGDKVKARTLYAKLVALCDRPTPSGRSFDRRRRRWRSSAIVATQARLTRVETDSAPVGPAASALDCARG
jgi:predicted Zn-dependent protease